MKIYRMSSDRDLRYMKILNTTLLTIFVILIAGSLFLLGIDFTRGILLGCSVVAINFFVSQKILARIVKDKKWQGWMLIVYLFKFSISMAILYAGVAIWNFNGWSIILGLSSIFVAVIISTVLRGIFLQDRAD